MTSPLFISKMVNALPEPPKLSASTGPEAFDTLSRLFQKLTDVSQLFSDSEGLLPPSESIPDLERLRHLGLLHQRAGKYFSHYLITPWDEANAFYITDFPDTGFRDEVFSPHPEQVYLTRLLQIRPDDEVLDLCTGSGILLLEALRKGAKKGHGVDISPRALAFARANAALNSIDTTFTLGDVTDSKQYETWGSPTVVLSNPPFEPIPNELPFRPLHSDAGPDGTAVFRAILDSLHQWTHKPAIFQFVLFSLGVPLAHTAEDLLMGRLLKEWVDKLHCGVDLQEMLAPISLEDYLAVHLETGSREVTAWLNEVPSEFRTIHLLFGTMMPARSKPEVHVLYHDDLALDDVCFAWPLASKKRLSARGAYRDSGSASRAFGYELMNEREKHIANLRVGYPLEGKAAQELLLPMLVKPMLYGDNRPLLILELHSDDPEKIDSDWNEVGLLEVDSAGKGKPRYRQTRDALEAVIKKAFRARTAVFTVTAWSQNATSDRHRQTTFLDWGVEVGKTADLVQGSFSRSAGMVQRFVIFAPTNSVLAPRQQRNCVNLLSELVYSHYTGDKRLEQAYLGVGHYLKNTVDMMRRLSDQGQKPDLSSLYQFSGMFELVGKLTRNGFTREYLSDEFVNWPAEVDEGILLARVADILRQETITYILREDVSRQVVLRMVDGIGIHLVDTDRFSPSDEILPPFSLRCRDVDLFLLAGLSEVCRNAVRAVINRKADIRAEYNGFLHVDFSVTANAEDRSVSVVVWNPFYGDEVPSAVSVERLDAVYQYLSLPIDLQKAAECEYALAKIDTGQTRYARAKFTFYPLKLEFR